MGGMDCCGEQSWQDAGCPNARAVVTVPGEIRRPVTADVQRELAEALWGISSDPGVMLPADERKLARLVEVTQRLIADAEKRATARELRAIGRAVLAATPGAHPVRVPVSYLFDRADALAFPAPAPQGEAPIDPAYAASVFQAGVDHLTQAEKGQRRTTNRPPWYPSAEDAR